LADVARGVGLVRIARDEFDDRCADGILWIGKMADMSDRITEVHVAGMRTLADVKLRLDGLTVLIGDNGSGKSSLIEACEILRRAGSESFADDLQKIHGGVESLLRFGATQLELGVRYEVNGKWELHYSLALNGDGEVFSESLTIEETLEARTLEDGEVVAAKPQRVLN